MTSVVGCLSDLQPCGCRAGNRTVSPYPRLVTHLHTSSHTGHVTELSLQSDPALAGCSLISRLWGWLFSALLCLTRRAWHMRGACILSPLQIGWGRFCAASCRGNSGSKFAGTIYSLCKVSSTRKKVTKLNFWSAVFWTIVWTGLVMPTVSFIYITATFQFNNSYRKHDSVLKKHGDFYCI